MTAPSPTVVEVLAAHPPTETPYGPIYCPPCSESITDWVAWTPEHVAQALADAGVLGPERARTFPDDYGWSDLMVLLDAHWPADLFPTLPDTDQRDPGPRIVSLIRWVDALRAKVERVEELHHRYGSDLQNGFCSHCRASWPCPTFYALRGES